MQSLPEHTQHLFDQYLLGDLSEAEQRELEQRLASDSELAQQWSEYQALTSYLKKMFGTEASAGADRDLRSHIAQSAADLEAEGFFTEQKEPSLAATSVRISPVRRYWALAAGLALALAAVWFFSRPNAPTNEQIFASNFRVEQAQLTADLGDLDKFGLGETDTEHRQALVAALALMEKSQFDQAIPLLRSWLTRAPSGPPTPSSDHNRLLARYYLAQANMAKGDTSDETVTLLTAVAADSTFPSAEDARWYLALCHIKNNHPQNAKPLLQRVAASTSSHAAEAAKLLHIGRW